MKTLCILKYILFCHLHKYTYTHTDIHSQEENRQSDWVTASNVKHLNKMLKFVLYQLALCLMRTIAIKLCMRYEGDFNCQTFEHWIERFRNTIGCRDIKRKKHRNWKKKIISNIYFAKVKQIATKKVLK